MLVKNFACVSVYARRSSAELGRSLRTLILLSGEDINSNQVDLGSSVLSSLGGGHIDDLAREILNPRITPLVRGCCNTHLTNRCSKTL